MNYFSQFWDEIEMMNTQAGEPQLGILKLMMLMMF